MLVKEPIPKDEPKKNLTSVSFLTNQLFHLLITRTTEKRINFFQNLTITLSSGKIIIPVVFVTATHITLLTEFHAQEGEVIGNEHGQWFVMTPDDEIIELPSNPYHQAEKIRAHLIELFLQQEGDDAASNLHVVLDAIQVWICFPEKTTYNPKQLRDQSRQWFHVMTPTSINQWLSSPAMEYRTEGNKSQPLMRTQFLERMLQFLHEHAMPITSNVNDSKTTISPITAVTLVNAKKEVKWFCDSCPASCKGRRIRQWTPSEFSQAFEVLKVHYLMFEYLCAMKGNMMLEDVICYMRSFFFHAARKLGLQLTNEQKNKLSKKIELLKKKLEREEKK